MNVKSVYFFKAPDLVQNMRCVATSWQSILVQWDPPARQNGKITQYVLAFQSVATFVSATDHAYTFRDLLSNTTYNFSIQAANSAGQGKKDTCIATTKSEEGTVC